MVSGKERVIFIRRKMIRVWGGIYIYVLYIYRERKKIIKMMVNTVIVYLQTHTHEKERCT